MKLSLLKNDFEHGRDENQCLDFLAIYGCPNVVQSTMRISGKHASHIEIDITDLVTKTRISYKAIPVKVVKTALKFWPITEG